MLFSYTIASRPRPSIGQSEHSGLIEASSPKEAILKAMADTFGNGDERGPMESLHDWADLDSLRASYGDLSSIATTLRLHSAGSDFVVEVEEANDLGPPWCEHMVKMIVADINDMARAVKTTSAWLTGLTSFGPPVVGFDVVSIGGCRKSCGAVDFAVDLKDVETGIVDRYELHVDAGDGTVYLHNKYNRVGYKYSLKLGHSISPFAD